MRKEIKYVACDGKEFQDEWDCEQYEKKVKAEKQRELQQIMQNLDETIWNHFHPDETDTESSSLELVNVWLRTDIVAILTDPKFDREESGKWIKSEIQKVDINGEIMNKYLSWNEIDDEVDIRSDYETAFNKVEHGYDLSGSLQYSFGKNDLSQLAALHKKSKCRRKIEELLEDCNFRGASSDFKNHNYEEYLHSEKVEK